MSQHRNPVDHYSNEVLAGRIIAGRLVRQACERHQRDRKDGHRRGLYFDPVAANRAIQFFPDVLVLPEVGTPFELEAWQKFIIGSLFGWKTVDAVRRFRHAYVEIGKGNGKTPMVAGIGLLMLAADGEPQAQCFAAATTRDQAHLLFQDAVKMRDASPTLAARVRASGAQKVFNLSHLPSGSFFRPVSSEHRGLDGLRVHFAALDEVHEHQSSIVVDKLRAGTKGRRQALIVEITNSGYDRNSICWRHHEYSEKLLTGIFENDAWFCYVCGLDEGDDWKNPDVWPKANPNLGVSIPAKYLEEQVKVASEIPGNELIVCRLNFCIWTQIEKKWMDLQRWDDCGADFDIAQLRGQPCYGGLDLASTTDMCSLCLVFPPTPTREFWAAIWRYWVPERAIVKRSESDNVPYDLWTRQGLITATPGDITDYDGIRRDVSGTYIEAGISDRGIQLHNTECLADAYKIVEIAYDRWNATQLVTQLTGDGLTMVPLGQGFQSMSAPMKELQRLIVGKMLFHRSHAVARWNVSNVVAAQDPAGNIKPDRARSSERIDGISALIDALARAMIKPDSGPSVYESRGLLTI